MYYLHYTYIIPFKGHILHLKGNTFFNFVKFSFKFWYTIINSLYRTKIEIQFTSFVLLLEALLLLAKNIPIYRNNIKLSSLKKQENALNLYEQAYIYRYCITSRIFAQVGNGLLFNICYQFDLPCISSHHVFCVILSEYIAIVTIILFLVFQIYTWLALISIKPFHLHSVCVDLCF